MLRRAVFCNPCATEHFLFSLLILGGVDDSILLTVSSTVGLGILFFWLLIPGGAWDFILLAVDSVGV